jgi:hypothetical protein
MATADITTGIGGLDASIVFETDRPENPGSAFNSSFGFFSSFMSARASMADLIALGVQVATRMCGGPLVPYQAGRIVPNGSQPDTTAHFDQTRTEFDNHIVTEYLENNSSNPLVVGPAETNSDQRIFASDGNVTIRGLADPKVFAARCATLLAKMIDTVPKDVQLTQVIVPYEVKPKEVRLTVASNTTLDFGGDFRVRTTVRVASIIS